MRTLILSQFYLRPELLKDNEPFYSWFWKAWRNLLAAVSRDAPILVVDNSSPIGVPYEGVRTIPNRWCRPQTGAIECHRDNWWTAIREGVHYAKAEGFENIVFISQNMLCGVPFLEECTENLKHHSALFNKGCLGEQNFYTEYFAMRVSAADKLFTLNPITLPELVLPIILSALDISVGPFPNFHHLRDSPLLETDTFAFHCTEDEYKRFYGHYYPLYTAADRPFHGLS